MISIMKPDREVFEFGSYDVKVDYVNSRFKGHTIYNDYVLTVFLDNKLIIDKVEFKAPDDYDNRRYRLKIVFEQIKREDRDRTNLARDLRNFADMLERGELKCRDINVSKK